MPAGGVADCKPAVVGNFPEPGGAIVGCPAVGVAGSILLFVAAGKCPVPVTLGNMPVRESRPAGRTALAFASGKTLPDFPLFGSKATAADGIDPVCQAGSKRLRGVKRRAEVVVPIAGMPVAVLFKGTPLRVKEARNASAKSCPQA